MKKLFIVIILLFISFTFTSCSKDVTPQVPTEETPTTEEGKETDSPENSEVDSRDETIEEETIIEGTTSSTETEEETSPQTETQSESEPVTIENTYYIGFGFIDSLYNYENNNYLSIDEAEFFWNPEALEEAIKDGHAMLNEDNIYALPNPYFIRNNYDTVTNYPISENCVYYV